MASDRRLLVAASILLLTGVFVVAATAFIWPRESRRLDLGSAEAFPAGSVTTFDFRDGRLLPARNGTLIANTAVHIVRLETGEILALSAKDPHLGCAVPWRHDGEIFVSDRIGWFINPCHGEAYDMAGIRVFGPSPRGLDRFGVEIESGRVIVDLDDFITGPASPGVIFTDGTPTPATNPMRR